jgi:hypothetical protein
MRHLFSGLVSSQMLLAVLLSAAIEASTVDAIAQTAPDATSLSLRGTLEQYDSTTRTVSVTTRSGTVTLTVVPTARIRQGRHEIDATTLAKLHGYRVVVRYAESAGTKLLQSIHVLDKSDAAGR